jgi:hypothetical protein
MNGLLIALVVLQSISLLVQLSHAGATQRLLNLALGVGRRP